MTIDFVKILPGGNTTILVESPVKIEDRAAVSNQLMSAEMLSAEQVGFISAPPRGMDARLDMMGGELCVNALRSLSALLFSRDSSKETCILSSSGAESPVTCNNVLLDNGNYYSSLALQISTNIEHLEDDCDLVRLNGIAHILQRVHAAPTHREILNVFNNVRRKYDKSIEEYPAFGVILYVQNGSSLAAFPVVHVRQTDSTVFETGCGSGSIALALLKNPRPDQKLIILQPSGYTYDVSISPSERGVSVRLGSEVRIVVKGTAILPPVRP